MHYHYNDENLTVLMWSVRFHEEPRLIRLHIECACLIAQSGCPKSKLSMMDGM